MREGQGGTVLGAHADTKKPNIAGLQAIGSSIYKLWKDRVPKVFNEGDFSATVVAIRSDLRIGIPLLASGISALIMRYTEEFCELSSR